MAIFKEVWAFQASGISGGNTWTEVYYSTAGSITQAATFHPGFLGLRLAMLHPTARLNKIRVSDIGNPRITSLVKVGSQGTADAAQQPAPIDSAIVCTLNSITGPGRRKLWLRGWSIGTGLGLGDAFRDPASGNDVFTAGFKQKLKSWLIGLASNAYIVLVRTKATVAGFQPFDVTNADGTSADGKTVLTLVQQPTFAVNDNILATKFSTKDLPSLSGTFKVIAVAANKVTITYTTPSNLAFNTPGAQVRKLVYLETATIDAPSSGPDYIGGRKSRGAFFGTRGARSAHRRQRTQS